MRAQEHQLEPAVCDDAGDLAELRDEAARWVARMREGSATTIMDALVAALRLELTVVGADPNLDCDGDGTSDACELYSGFALDCNGNDVPDNCDVDPTDPDGDGWVSEDCNENVIPDECEVGACCLWPDLCQEVPGPACLARNSKRGRLLADSATSACTNRPWR